MPYPLLPNTTVLTVARVGELLVLLFPKVDVIKIGFKGTAAIWGGFPFEDKPKFVVLTTKLQQVILLARGGKQILA